MKNLKTLKINNERKQLQMKAVILAAGYATRLYPVTLNKPKALLEVGKRTVLDYIIDEVETIDAVNQILIISNQKFIKQFIAWYGQRKSKKCIKLINDGSTSDENKLGAIGDLQFVIEKENIKEDIMVIAGDNLFSYKLMDFYKFYLREKKDCILVQQNNNMEELKRMGVALLDDNGRVIKFEEKSSHPISNIAVYASYIYVKDTLPLISLYLKEKNDPDAPGHFPAWLCNKKSIYAYKFKGKCYDIGTHESYAEVQTKYDIMEGKVLTNY